MSLEIPLGGEQEHLKEFFEVAEQHFKDDRLKSYETFIQYVDSMERQCADMREEIGYDLQPSKEDINLTRRIELAGELLGIPLLDHIILGHGRYMSLREKGYMKLQWGGQEEVFQAAEKERKERRR